MQAKLTVLPKTSRKGDFDANQDTVADTVTVTRLRLIASERCRAKIRFKYLFLCGFLIAAERG